MTSPDHDSGGMSGGYLEGQMLIAMPTMGDPRFERTLIYLCAHGEEGAIGLVVNKPVTNVSVKDLLEQLGIEPPEDPENQEVLASTPILFGGPVETGRGFVLHTPDYASEGSTLWVDRGLGLTATLDILKAIAKGDGPQRALLALGYSGWAPGQLESEIQANGWLHCDADSELIFGADLDAKYERALKKLGVDLSLLSGDAGHA